MKWIPGDYHELDSLKQALHGASVAYLLASSTVPGDLHVNPATELNDNVVGALQFIDTCLLLGVKRIVFASSASVYGTQERLPISESAPTNPISAHGIHKLTVEKFLLLARHLHGIEVRILRIGNPFGPEQRLKGRQGFVAIAIGELLRHSTLPLRDTGRAIRDFVYIDDVAEALTMAGLMDGLPSIINVATGKGHSLSEVLALIERHTGQAVKTRAVESRIVDIPSSVLDIGLARKVMNYDPRHELSDGIRITLGSHGIPVLGSPKN